MARSVGRRDVWEMRWEVVQVHLNTNQEDDYWCSWDVPDKVKSIVEPYDVQVEEFMIGGSPNIAPAGKRTGVLRCTLLGCKCGTKKHRTALNKTHTDKEAVRRFVKKHRLKGESIVIQSWNSPDTVLDADKNKDDLRIAQIRLLSAKGLPLTLFNSNECRELMQVICRDHVYADEKIKNICVCAKTITTFCDKQAMVNVTNLKKILPVLIKMGRVNVTLDHKFVTKDSSGRTKILGISISIANENLERQSIMIEYTPMIGTSKDENFPAVKQVLEEYEIWEAGIIDLIRIISMIFLIITFLFKLSNH